MHPLNCVAGVAQDAVESGVLSGLQLESIVYACQRHEQFLPDTSRCAFFIGDGEYGPHTRPSACCSIVLARMFSAWYVCFLCHCYDLYMRSLTQAAFFVFRHTEENLPCKSLKGVLQRACQEVCHLIV